MVMGNQPMREGLVMRFDKVRWLGLGFGLWFGARSRIPTVD